MEKDIRLAKPGEFTMRSFLSGKMDLTQAEAVSDLIYSVRLQCKIALSQMREVFKWLKVLREVITLCFNDKLELDFGEEDVDFANKSELENLIKKLESGKFKRII